VIVMAVPFRRLLGRWIAQRDDASWVTLFNGSLVQPLAYLHPAAWSPLCAASRRHLLQARQPSARAAQHLWVELESRSRAMLPPLSFALQQAPLWRLVMCLTRRELLTLALWCGACVVRRRVAGAVDRASAARWRARLGERLYADVLRVPCDLGSCRPLPPVRELASGRLLLDLGLSMLAAWAADAEGWASRRIAAAAGPHHQPAEHYLGPEALMPVETLAAEPALLSFVERQCHAA
jgi:hypothetical protein